ncbi:hypothetical protein KM043_000540 [Ampulex compressa]|nr:hypothetical protein KM043_000540 [Ampulex compressa]
MKGGAWRGQPGAGISILAPLAGPPTSGWLLVVKVPQLNRKSVTGARALRGQPPREALARRRAIPRARLFARKGARPEMRDVLSKPEKLAALAPPSRALLARTRGSARDRRAAFGSIDDRATRPSRAGESMRQCVLFNPLPKELPPSLARPRSSRSTARPVLLSRRGPRLRPPRFQSIPRMAELVAWGLEGSRIGQALEDATSEGPEGWRVGGVWGRT